MFWIEFLRCVDILCICKFIWFLLDIVLVGFVEMVVLGVGDVGFGVIVCMF